MRHRTSEILYNYWVEVRAGRLAPRRVDIEPSRIASILPDTLIIEHVDPSSYRFRLAGTRLCERFGTELRGTNFLSLWSRSDQQIIQRQLTLIASSGTAAVINTHSTTSGGQETHGELVILPLSNPAGKINRFMGAWSPAKAVHWYGSDYEVNHAVTGHSIINPDQMADSYLARQTQEAPPALKFHHEVRTVKRDRRRFRVFEGGLGQSPDVKR